MSDQPTKATREHVEKMIKCSPFALDNGSIRLDWVAVLNDYLAQGEELKGYKEENFELINYVTKLKAENQELKTLLAQERHDHNLEVEAYQEQLMNVTQGGMAQLKAREIEIEALKDQRQQEIQDAINEYRGDLRC